MKTSSHRSHCTQSKQLRETVGSKNTGRIVNQAVGSSQRARVESLTSVKANTLYKRKIEKKEISPEKSQAQPGLRKYNFKIQSKKQTTSIIAIPLGSKGIVTEWNPDGLNTKELLKKKYDEGAKNPRSTVFGYFYTPYVPLSPEGIRLNRQVFKVSRGFDIAVSITRRNDDGTISAGRFLPYTTLAPKLDSIVERMVESGTHSERSARHRINGDIIRVGSGTEIKGRYREEEWHDLAEFAMVIRADKARAPQSTRYYIDKNIREYSTSFKERFGNGADSTYEGAPKGGAKKIKERKVLYINLADADLTDVVSGRPPNQYSRSA